MVETLVHVDGLLTVHCARNVEAALKRLPGVHHADANYVTRTATVHFDEKQMSLGQIQAADAHAGHAMHARRGAHRKPPFGMSDKVFGFLLTTPVMRHGAWPSFVGVRNALRQGVLMPRSAWEWPLARGRMSRRRPPMWC